MVECTKCRNQAFSSGPTAIPHFSRLPSKVPEDGKEAGLIGLPRDTYSEESVG